MTIYRHTMTDGSLPLEKVAAIQVEGMRDEALIAGKKLDDVTVVFSGPVADAFEDAEAKKHLPALLEHQDISKLSIVIHSAELVKK